MVSDSALSRLLRSRVTKFLGGRSQAQKALRATLARLREHCSSAVFFGGILRDLMVFGPSPWLRDVDIVIDDKSMTDVASLLRRYIRRRTRFGGLALNVHGWRIDLWPLSQTWAFREHLVKGRDFADLPQTTFLDVEAAAVDVFKTGRARRIHSHGFFEALRSRTIDVNLVQNPYPDLCIVRSMLLASRLGFSIGPRLVDYIVHYSEKYDLEELLEVQRSHYGLVRRSIRDLRFWIRGLREHHRRSRNDPFPLPDVEGLQQDLWASTNWEFAAESLARLKQDGPSSVARSEVAFD